MASIYGGWLFDVRQVSIECGLNTVIYDVSFLWGSVQRLAFFGAAVGFIMRGVHSVGLEVIMSMKHLQKYEFEVQLEYEGV